MTSAGRDRLLWIGLVAILWGSLEAISYVALWAFGELRGVHYRPVDRLSEKHRVILDTRLTDDRSYMKLDATLGWTIRPGASWELYRSNSRGVRSDREYAVPAPPGVVRIAAYGDSFTHGNDVENPAAWPAQLETLIPALEVVNLGVGGYGLDQAYLRHLEDGRGFQPDFALVGFMPGDLHRNVNTYRPFLSPDTSLPAAKPRFMLAGAGLAELSNPLASPDAYRRLLADPPTVLNELGAHDAYFEHRYKAHPLDWAPSVRLVRLIADEIVSPVRSYGLWMKNKQFDPDSEAFRVTIRLFEEFHRTLEEEGIESVIVILPSAKDVRWHRRGEATRYEPLLAALEARGLVFIDLVHAFSERGATLEMDELFVGHYSVAGNRIVAEALGEMMAERGWLPSEEAH